MSVKNTILSRAVAAVATVSLATMGLPAAAFAAAGDLPATGTVDCGNGWVLSYSSSGGEAQITGVASAPARAAALTIPSSAGGASVSSVGSRAFYENKVLSTVSLPSTLKIVGSEAFRTSSITSVSFPKSLKGIDANAFSYCSSLASVTFESGSMPEYLGEMAFAYDSSLKAISVPPLDGYSYRNSGWSATRVGKWCFKSCASLERVEFLAGSSSGATEYFISSTAPFDDSNKGLVIFFYAKRGVGVRDFQTYGTTFKVYNAVNYYQSEAAFLADPKGLNPWKQVLVSTDAKLINLARGKIEGCGYNPSDTLPSLPSSAVSQGYVWGIDEAHTAATSTAGNTSNGISILSSTIDDVTNLYPVDPRDMDYNFITSDAMQAYAANNSLNAVHATSEYQRLRADGTVDLSNMKVITCMGTEVDPSAYTFSFRRVTTTGTTATNRVTTYTPLASVADVNQEGDYQVMATGVGSYAKTATAWTDFHVKRYDATIHELTSTVQSDNTGSAAHDAVSYIGYGARFMTYAPASNWQACLVATSLAAVGDGLAAYLDASPTSSEPFQALSASGLDTVTFVGSKSALGTDNVKRVKDILGSEGVVNYFDYSDASELALQVYQTVVKYGPRDDDPYYWGDTAVVCSGSSCLDSALVAQYACQLKAPVFFTNASGGLDAAVLDAIAGGGFANVIIAGGEALVSQEVEASLAARTGVEPVRVLDQGSSLGEVSLANIAQLQGMFASADGEPLNTTARLCIASAENPSNVFAAAQLAAIEGGVALSVASSADGKLIAQALIDGNPDFLSSIYLIGDYSKTDPGMVERMKGLWTAASAGTVGIGDSVLVDGMVYRLDSASKATVLSSLEPLSGELSIGSFDYNGASYSVTAIGAGAFAGTGVTKVTLPAAVTKIGANAFEGCTKLSSVSSSATTIGASAFKGCTTLTKISTKATTIGASAFQGCTALKSAALSGAVTSLGSKAFMGCSKLTTVTLSSAKLKKIGASAFNGCKKLKTLSIKSAKLTAVGSKALTGTPASLKVKCPKAKMVAYKKLLTKAGMSAKASVAKI